MSAGKPPALLLPSSVAERFERLDTANIGGSAESPAMVLIKLNAHGFIVPTDQAHKVADAIMAAVAQQRERAGLIVQSSLPRVL